VDAEDRVSVPIGDVAICGQKKCGKTILWGMTVREPDGQGGMRGGKRMPMDYPLPAEDPAHRQPAGANLAVRRDAHGTWWVRVLKRGEQPYADERWAVTHWSTCANPPGKGPRQVRPQLEAPPPQDGLFDVAVVTEQTPGRDKVRALLSNENLFPRRRRG
jgi:hypothetical protein